MESQCIYHLSNLMRIGSQIEVTRNIEEIEELVQELKMAINVIVYLKFTPNFSFYKLNPMINSAFTVLQFQLYRFNKDLGKRYKDKLTTVYTLMSQVANDDKSGIRTHAVIPLPELESGPLDHSGILSTLATAGLEPATPTLEVSCSIQLS